MTQERPRLIWLRRRYRFNVIPLIIINMLILYAIFIRLYNFGFHSTVDFFITFVFGFVILNFISALPLLDIVRYRLGYDKYQIFVRPFLKFGPYLRMKFEEIGVVDIKPLSDIYSKSKVNSYINAYPSLIILYRSKWDGEEVFALDSIRTNLLQFKDLVRQIYERRPETFTENALRYLNSQSLVTPREDAEGQLIW